MEFNQDPTNNKRVVKLSDFIFKTIFNWQALKVQ